MGASVATAIASSMHLLARLREINKKVEDAEFSSALADLGLELARLKSEMASVLNENTNLKAQLAAKRAPPQSLEHRNGKYYKPDGDGPFCTGCYDNAGKAIRLTKVPAPFRDIASHSCPVCNATY